MFIIDRGVCVENVVLSSSVSSTILVDGQPSYTPINVVTDPDVLDHIWLPEITDINFFCGNGITVPIPDASGTPQ